MAVAPQILWPLERVERDLVVLAAVVPDLAAEAGGIGKMLDGRLDDLGHLVGLGAELERRGDMGHRGIDAVVARRDVEGRQFAQHPDRAKFESQLLRGLAQGRGLDGFAGVLLPAREGDLAAVMKDALGPPRQEDPEPAVLG